MAGAELAIEMATRLASGRADADALRWLQDGLRAWLKGEGAIGLEHCLRLPSSAPRARLMRRNVWLATAAAQVECASPWEGAGKLAEEYERFLSRGTWRAWRDQAAPPIDASQLRGALFHVAKAHGGRSLSQKQIDRIVGHIFRRNVSDDRAR